MKILYMHQYFATRDSSTGTRSYEFARILKERGHEVEVLTGDSQLGALTEHQTKRFGTYEVDGITVHAIRNRYENNFSKWRRIWAFLQFLFLACFFQVKHRKYDIIFATSTPLTIGIPALFLSWKSKTPFVFEVRDLWPEAPYQLGYIQSRFIYRILCYFESLIYKQATHIVALSPGMKNGVIAHGVTEKKISVIPNSADIELFDVASTGEIRLHFQLQDKFILAHVGSMGVINGLDYLIESARILDEQGREDIVILLTGDGGKRVELENMVASYGLKNVIFTGKIPKKDIPTLMADVDATIMSVKHHPILEMASPNKFFDSLAAGKPTLVNCEGWMKDMVEEYQSGLFVRPTKPSDIVQAVDALKLDVENNFGKNAYRLAIEHFDRRKLAQKLEHVLKEAMKARG
ncbi:glycosyltransferase family 4 protein [Listeria grandensis]|uniref:Glycosyltransferase family 4 protein n=1 Tax=Listeria grandensis TaxID=1494963 RepID=A0A7X0Y3K2_9LIST|nr:glycosyltransferase family 4 protein [Listeria grandensis]MBC1474443.1 glycosyltransferase family 4 protein [Listeria grandensis]MBC1935989.1 glycosyltransferase family 4 protein [Listeria grandensis]